MTASDFVPLPGGDWRVWKAMVLRSAGFPIRTVDRLADQALADCADTALKAVTGRGRRAAGDDFAVEFAAATTRAAAAIRATAGDPRFREAVTWQTPALVGPCVDVARRAPGTRDSRARKREAVIAAYLQRYATKNDSIGFFGPVGWASWRADAGSTATAGTALLSRRTVYFEAWGLDAVCLALAARPELRPALPPRRIAANAYHHDHVVLPGGARVGLSAEQATVLPLCDGVRAAEDIAGMVGWPIDRLLDLLDTMVAGKLVRLEFGGPIEARPETRLLSKLARVSDAAARRRAVADVERLIAAKEAVAAAAGDPDGLAHALAALATEFQELTGQPATRAPGKTYAARTIAFEDTVRAATVELGADILAALGEPLSLLLDSGRWLATQIARDYLHRLDTYFERRRQRTGSDRIPLAALMALATRDFYTARGVPAAAEAAMAELQRRWATILAVPDGVRHHEVAVADIADRVRAAFATEAPPWSSGHQHSPDMMIAAESVEALNRGEFLLVLGELHLTINTVEARALVEQSPDPARLLAMAELAAGDGRIVPVAPREWGTVTRLSPPSALLSPRYTYWAQSIEDVCDLPSDPLPVAALMVTRAADCLTVQHVADGREFPLADVIGDYLSRVVVNAFRMLPPRRYTPRVSIGRLVVARERWRLPVRKCNWANQLDERERYLQMRAWVARHGLPRRVFCAVSVETKPMYVDFTSLALTNNLASVIRRMAADGSDGDVVLSEMLPDVDGCWLPDGDDERYAAEFRMVVTERGRQ
jgi:hypothetical protein